MLSTTGRIYKIICNLDSSFCYIGSTFNQLRQRWQKHKQHYKENKGIFSIHEYFDKYGIENFKIIKIKSYNVIRTHNKDFKHLHAYETLWINKTKNCVNKQVPFQPLKKEKKKETNKIYRENNKEQIKEKDKIYRENNKEQINKKHREYYENNKDKKKEYASQNWYCSICDKNMIVGSKHNHLKSKKHLNKII
jgi:hypothetical protein